LPPHNISESQIRDWCMSYIKQNVDQPASELSPDNTFAEMGLDSATSVYFVVELEEWLGLELDPEIVGEYPTIGGLAHYLAARIQGSSPG
jgi:acyl carrier protein